MKTVLLLTGVTKRDEVDSGPCRPDWVLNDYTELTALVRELAGAA
jgi:ribonucleotide monophosphatase NagD (HAD superfamily)